ncbi:MAG: DUF5689 domain-containing protein [Ferruginibacter sp.]
MTKFLKSTVAVLLMLTTAAFIHSCKKSFDNPPAYVDPNITANTTIKTLKAMHASGGYEQITTDIIISGVVTADDKSGNFYKELYIQDASGAIALELNGTNLYTEYPIGRKIFIKLKGLYLSDYAGMIQIGTLDNTVPNNPTLTGIPYTLFDNYILRGTFGNDITPRQVTLAQLGTNLQDTLLGTLIQLNGYEFSAGDTSKIYADTSSLKNSVNLTVKDCGGNSVIVRTSGYANFAGVHPAGGNGSITAIYTKYNTTQQLILRSPADVNFTGGRCSLFEEDFNSIGANSATLTPLPGWKDIGEVGGVFYKNAVFGSTKCAKVEANATGVAVVTSWLITPPIPLPAGSSPKFTFTNAAGYDNGATFKVLISTNYNGSNTPSSSTWTQLPATIYTGPASGYGTLASSGVVNLAAYAGQTVYIGFRYDGADPASGTKKTTTFEFDDVKILKQ